MIKKETTFLIVGLGLLGGSYAMALKQRNYQVIAIDINEESIKYAVEKGIIDEGISTDKDDFISKADAVILCLYPHDLVNWIRSNQKHIKPNAFITDVCGVKTGIIEEIQGFLRTDLEFISAHPMAGKEVSGVKNSDSLIFLPANLIITPTKRNSEAAIDFINDLANILRFKHISVLPPEKHDEMIAFLSQLPHVIAVCLMNCKDSKHLINYTGDSFRDLTRIAKINENLWSELFSINKDILLEQMDLFENEFKNFRSIIAQDDVEGMKKLFANSTKRRKEFDT